MDEHHRHHPYRQRSHRPDRLGRITEDNVPAKLKARVHKYLVDMGYFDDVEE